MRDNLKKAEDELIHVSKQRDYFRGETKTIIISLYKIRFLCVGHTSVIEYPSNFQLLIKKFTSRVIFSSQNILLFAANHVKIKYPLGCLN